MDTQCRRCLAGEEFIQWRESLYAIWYDIWDNELGLILKFLFIDFEMQQTTRLSMDSSLELDYSLLRKV